ncbi:MAG: DNA mismatch repair endonuclease MutL [Saprospiraceae bacterium]|jgi:DNA mismatch repair protein MutL|nr:DNA mismatch repair endonuclease MutL [Saprospiraceae bacterium]MDP4821336.1 DNA mismatch repair endonuclease MutL [Saprospiraceae bacterium]MDP4999385.1 DNA mismatch repair endonuclease MutL [Saprospiraceae bacterium]
MSDIIQLLPDAIANQIAAGEVVQRPGSALKELMENAIDAGATTVNVFIKDAGKTLIQVVDNGCGMSPRDARLSIERHATSKIRKAEDIFAIRTMGFRGEALASIAAIAQVELKTRRQSDEHGVLLQVANSEIISEEACQMIPGTSISVKNLFFNVPARRNFLKSDRMEFNHLLNEFQRIAMAYPDIFFTLHRDSQEVYHLPAVHHKQRISALMGGSQMPKKLIDVTEETDVVGISGFVSKPEYSKKARGDQYFFVNKRFIRSPFLHHAVVSAFEDLLPADAHPLYAIFLDVEPHKIDVNVHPTKQEIKFEDERLIYNYLKVAVRHALGKYSIIPRMDFDQEGSFSQDRLNQPMQQFPEVPTPRFNSKATNDPGISFSDVVRNRHNLENWESIYEGLTASAAHTPDAPQATLTLESSFHENNSDQNTPAQQGLKAPYQIHGMYIVTQIKSGFLLIDQQAAHERILYERFKQILEQQTPSVQRQLFPKTLEFSPKDAAVLSEIMEDIRLLGFDIEAFGKNAFIVNGVPEHLSGQKEERALLETLIDQFNRNLELRLDARENIARSMARSAAIRSGQLLEPTEMQGLIDQLFACEIPFKSPSGKNCIITFDLDELARRFDHP